jgi:NSS family neurotransmitter:Na+ symporter
LLAVAAWTSAISLLEPIVAWLVESLQWSRRKASALAGLSAWVLGIGSLLSFNHWAEFKPFGRNYFEWSEFLSTTIMLPTGGLLVAIFVGWRMSRASSLDELQVADGVFFVAWRFLVRFVAPLGVLVIFLNAVGLV